MPTTPTPGPHGIDLTAPGGVDELLAYHRSLTGSLRMQDGAEGTPQPAETPAPPERPTGISETEWDALGDPGKAALVRERSRSQDLERQLAAARAARQAKPTPPPGHQSEQPPAEAGAKTGSEKPADVATLVQQAVQAAMQPLLDAQTQATAEAGARRVADAVTAAAGAVLHDPTDALALVDLTSVVDEHGAADASKIKAALDGLVAAKPHLAKAVDTRRTPPPGAMLGGTPAQGLTEADLVKRALSKMQAATGVKLPSTD